METESRNYLVASLGSILPSLYPRLATKHQARIGVKFKKQNKRSPKKSMLSVAKGPGRSCVFKREATWCQAPLTLKNSTEDP